MIIGSGPAGLTAAIYAARANLNPLVIEGGAPNLPGGQLMITSDVENFPGFAHGIMGPDLMDQMRQQAGRVGAEFLTENVASVDFSQRPFHIKTDDNKEFWAKTAIVTTGASAKWLGLPTETALYGKGVSACATCDGFFLSGPRSRGCRRRRYRFGRSQLPDPHGLESDDYSPPGHAARLADHAEAGVRQPQDRVRLELCCQSHPRSRSLAK